LTGHAAVYYTVISKRARAMNEVELRISPSTVKAFNRCKRSYYYKVVEGLETRLPSLPMRRGSWMHECLQYHYMGRDWRVAHKKLTKQFNRLFLEEREYYGDLPNEVERMMKGYLYHYRNEDKDWEILHVEETFVVEHPNGHEFSFKPDLVVYDKALDQTVCWDHKTTKSVPSAEFRMQDLQSGFYPWGLRLAGVNVDTFGYNYIKTKPPTIPSINLNGEISRRRIDTDYYTLATFLMEYYADSWPDIPKTWKVQLQTLKNSNAYLKRTKMVKPQAVENRMVEELDYTTQEMAAWYEFMDDQEGDPWTRTMIKSCEWDCDFQELCLIELMGGDGKFIRRTKYQPSKYMEGRKLGR
jgi:hypothetical protein